MWRLRSSRSDLGTRMEIPVISLSVGDDFNQTVELPIKILIGVSGQRVTCGFDGLEQIGVVTTIAFVSAIKSTSGPLKISDAAFGFTHANEMRNRALTICSLPLGPEGTFDFNFRVRNRQRSSF